MLFDLFYSLSEALGLSFWVPPAILVGIVMVIMLVVHIHNQKKREKKYDEARKEKLEALQKASGTEENAQ